MTATKLTVWLALPAMLSIGLAACAPGAGQDEAALALKGKPAPDVTLELLDGGQVKLADHKGKDVVILDFWATWCGPCIEGLPIVAQVAKEHADKHVVFYAVNQEEEAGEVKAFLKEHKLNLKVALDTKSKVGDAFLVNGIPETVIVGKDGVIKYIHIGISPEMGKELTDELDKAITGKADPAK